MPELPDIVVYLEALTRHIVGRRLERLTLHSPFVLRTVDPPIDAMRSQIVRGVRRIGKRIVLLSDDDLFLGRFPREGHGVPSRDGGARPLQAAVSGVRRAGAADYTGSDPVVWPTQGV